MPIIQMIGVERVRPIKRVEELGGEHLIEAFHYDARGGPLKVTLKQNEALVFYAYEYKSAAVELKDNKALVMSPRPESSNIFNVLELLLDRFGFDEDVARPQKVVEGQPIVVEMYPE
jgi:hypothetical protein